MMNCVMVAEVVHDIFILKNSPNYTVMKKMTLVVALTIVVWVVKAQRDHGSHGVENRKEMNQMSPIFKDQAVGEAYLNYVELKNALVASDAIKSGDAAAQLVLVLQEVKSGGNAFKSAKMVSDAKDLEAQRKMFAMLNTDMIELIKSSKLRTGIIYLDYCPMANQSRGAYWLSNEAAIMNPYYGEKMMKCGSVKETIE